MPKTPRTILALDPGLRELGYAVLSGKRLITSGVLQLRAVSPRRRIGRVQESFEAWMRAYRPRVLVLEHIPKRPLDAIAGLPALGRRLRRLAKRKRIGVASYSARTVRQSVLGDGWAGKREVAAAVPAQFPELRVHLHQSRKWQERHWQNMFDAIALGLHHQTVTNPPSRSRSSG